MQIPESAILALKLRPKRFSEVIGQRNLIRTIRKQIVEREPHAWLFHGPSGCGKTTMARIVALSYQCSHQETWGEPCDECWSRWSEFAIHEINASEVNKVEQIGEIVEQARYRPQLPSKRRVFILDEAQRVTTAGQNLLLKPLEQTNSSTVWIICTTEPNKLLLTLRRRCMTYALRPLSLSNTEAFVRKIARQLRLKVDLPELFDAIHMAGIHAPGILLMVLDKLAAGASIKEAVWGLSEESQSALAICKAVTRGDWKTLRKILENVGAEDSRLIRAAVAGWLRKALLHEVHATRRRTLATSLQMLMAPAPLEDQNLMYWLTGTLYLVCMQFGDRK